MDLAAWMVERGFTDQSLANEVGVTRPYITRIRNGVVHPNLGTALSIWNFTDREIEIEYLLPIHARPRPEKKKPAARTRSVKAAA